MKTSIRIALMCFLIAGTGRASTTITLWDFNSRPPDSSTSTGTNAPSLGAGEASLLGGVTATFAAGSTNDPATSADDSAWNTSGYPAIDSSNKTAGVQFHVSTLGYSNIVVSWDHKVSGSASKYCRLQYSSDGINFTDYPTPISAEVVSTTGSYFERQTNSLAAYPEVNDNANFAFRIVSEFESTAVGGSDNYVTTAGGNYSTVGTIRFDFVAVLGTPIPGANTPPTVSAISNQTMRVNQSTGVLPFTIGDAQDAASSLDVTAGSSDVSVIPDTNIHLGGSGPNRTISVDAGPQTGSSIITLWVADTGGRSNSVSFTMTILPLNTAPVISTIASTNILANQSTPEIPFTIYDLETPSANLTLAGSSENISLVPNGNIAFGGSGSNRTVTITPVSGQSGVAPIRISVTDGTNISSSLFTLMVLPSSDVLFYDPFPYNDGALVTNSAFLWTTRSGTPGECQVINGQVEVRADQTEDVIATLVGSPYSRSNSTVLYASFKFKALGLPKNTPGYFARFSSGNANRGRVYAGTTNAVTGFHLFVSNGSDETTMFPGELNTNIVYFIVTRYDVDTATTTLWLNPASESAPSVTASDVANPASISYYGFRQDSSVGATMLVDDLRVGLNFSSVLPGTVINSIPLNFQHLGTKFVLNWSDPSFVLQSAPLVSGIYTNINGASSPYTNSITQGARFFRLVLGP